MRFSQARQPAGSSSLTASTSSSARRRADETWSEPPGRAVRPEAASSVGPIAIHYWASLRPCLGTAIAPRRRARFRQTLLKEAVGAVVRGGGPDVLAAELRHDPAARRPLQEAELEQIRLVDVLDRVGLLAERDRKGGEPDRAAVESLHHRAQESAVDPLEPALVDLHQVERLARDRRRNGALVPDLGDVPNTAQDPVRDPRRSARAAGDLVGGLL